MSSSVFTQLAELTSWKHVLHPCEHKYWVHIRAGVTCQANRRSHQVATRAPDNTAISSFHSRDEILCPEDEKGTSTEKKFENWSVDDVYHWVAQQFKEEHASNLKQNEVDGNSFLRPVLIVQGEALVLWANKGELEDRFQRCGLPMAPASVLASKVSELMNVPQGREPTLAQLSIPVFQSPILAPDDLAWELDVQPLMASCRLSEDLAEVRLEFKEGPNDLPIGEKLCALVNYVSLNRAQNSTGIGRAWLIVGITDQGKIATTPRGRFGVDHVEAASRHLNRFIANNICPYTSIESCIKHFKIKNYPLLFDVPTGEQTDFSLIVFRVSPISMLCSYAGKYYDMLGSNANKLSLEQIKQRRSILNGGDVTALRASFVLDHTLFQKYLSALSSGKTNTTLDQEKLVTYGLSQFPEANTTIAGEILFGKRYTARWLVFNENEELAFEHTYEGLYNLLTDEVLSRIQEQFPHKDHIIYSGFYRITIPNYSSLALREAIANAIIHADYGRPGVPIITIQSFKDRLTVVNTCSLCTNPKWFTFSSITVNHTLVNLLQKAGIVETIGSGLRTITCEMLKDGRKLPVYDIDLHSKTWKLTLFNGPLDYGLISVMSYVRVLFPKLPHELMAMLLVACGKEGKTRKWMEEMYLDKALMEVLKECKRSPNSPCSTEG